EAGLVADEVQYPRPVGGERRWRTALPGVAEVSDAAVHHRRIVTAFHFPPTCMGAPVSRADPGSAAHRHRGGTGPPENRFPLSDLTLTLLGWTPNRSRPSTTRRSRSC